MGRDHLAVVSALVTAACVLPYLRDVRRGTTRPHRTSWCVFAVLAVVAAVSQAIAQVGPGIWLAAGSAVGFGAVFVASIRHGVGGSTLADRAALAVASVGIVTSLATARPMFAVAGVVVAEIGAVALTVRKALADPESETRSTWTADAVAGVLAIAAVDHVTAASLLYPVHHTVANAAVVAAIAVGHRRARRRPPTNRPGASAGRPGLRSGRAFERGSDGRGRSGRGARRDPALHDDVRA